MYALAPLAAVAIALLFGLHPEIAATLIAFAISPMPPFLPAAQIRAGGEAPYSAALLTASSLLAVVTVPVTMWLLGEYFGISLITPESQVVQIILATVILPLAAGVALHHLAPGLAASLAKPVSLVAGLLLAISGIALAAASWSAIWSLAGDGTLIAIVAITAIGLAIGYLLGGPTLEDRASLALATAARHPAVALAVVGANVADRKHVLAAALLYLIVGTLVTTPFVRWRGRQHVLPMKPS
jgi:BASS family bile acid:Na+ symporter